MDRLIKGEYIVYVSGYSYVEQAQDFNYTLDVMVMKRVWIS